MYKRQVEACEPSLVITVDNGIAARDEVVALAGRGIDIVVTDHHEPSDLVPVGIPVTDPKMVDESPSRELDVYKRQRELRFPSHEERGIRA